jgi:hypothetical protein
MGPFRALYEYLTKYFVQMQVAEFDMDTILRPYETAQCLNLQFLSELIERTDFELINYFRI